MTRPTSAVIKPTYTRSVRNAQGSARYYAGRANGTGERQQRDAFDKENDTISREDVSGRLEAADEEGSSYYYRFVMSPGTEAEPEGDLKSWTRDVMAELEVQQGGALTWAAYEHSGDDAHSEHAHVHVVAATDRKLDQSDLQALREVATEAWERQQAFAREVGRDPMQEETYSAERESAATRDTAHDHTNSNDREGDYER